MSERKGFAGFEKFSISIFNVTHLRQLSEKCEKKSVKWPIKDWIWQKTNCIKVSQFVFFQIVYEITKIFCQCRKKEKRYGKIVKKKFWTKKSAVFYLTFPTIQINFNQVPPISLTTMFLFISILNLQLLPFFSRDNYSDNEITVRSPLHSISKITRIYSKWEKNRENDLHCNLVSFHIC